MRASVLGCLAVLLAGIAAPAQEPAAENAGAAADAPLVRPAQSPEAPDSGAGTALPDTEGAHLSVPHFWARTDGLLWWIKDGHAPPLVTTGAATDALPGALGMNGTSVAVGGNVDYEERCGARLDAGLWLDEVGRWGLDAGYFFLGSRSARFSSAADGSATSAVIARPFYDVLRGRQDASLVAYPGLIGGRVDVTAPSFLQGAEANGVSALWHSDQGRLELLAGFRFLNLDEDLDIAEHDQVSAAAPVFPGDAIAVDDHFATRNYFYGGQLGLRGEYRWGRWAMEAVGKVALGDTHEAVIITGATAITPPSGPAQSYGAGLLALPSNSGRFERDAFAVVPEVTLNVRYRVTNWLSVYAGYTFLYWSEVARPGDQVDAGVDRRQVPTSILAGGGGATRPAFSFAGTDFWAQGINIGLEFRY
jgi:hypothetical protein